MRRKLAANTFLPLVLEAVTIISGFILPRYILKYYGSDVNGLVASITQFISIISFFEAGVGSVVRFNLYKPLAEKDNAQVSKIVISATKFFKTIGIVLLIYTVFLMLFYPLFAGQQFGHMYTALLIAAMVISSFAQYFFGQANMHLVMADQRGYVQYSAQILTITLNTIACVVLMTNGFGIHAVKLATSFIYLLRPFILSLYVKKHYCIDYKIKYTEEPIKQKWNGLAQHISAVVLDGTDVIVLTVLSTLASVSIYSVYYMVVSGIKKLITNATGGIEALLGNVIAKDNHEELDNIFSKTEWSIHTIGTVIYGCAATLAVPFVHVYTRGITDADYNVPLFALLIVLAYYCHTLRLPYNLSILTAGHYKKTQKCYIIAAVMNIVVSVILVFKFGLIGVAIGTIVAMLYQTIWMAVYSYNNIIKRNIKKLIKQLIVDIISIAIMILTAKSIDNQCENYLQWFIMALKTASLCTVEAIIINICFYRHTISTLFKMKKNS